MTARFGLLAIGIAALSACSSDDVTIGAEQAFAGKCASPRAGTTDVQGTLDDEKTFLRLWIDDLYLWYREVPMLDPAQYATPIDYFAALKTPATTPAGHPKDPSRFHFTYPTDEWNAKNQAGVEAGYGVQWVSISRTPPRELVVAYVQADTPASAAGLARGAHVQTVDGVDFANGTDLDTLNNGLSPSASGQKHTFVILDRGATTPRTVTMTSANVASNPVLVVTAVAGQGGLVGYILFNDHVATAEALLIDAVGKLKAAGIVDLVLDLRYNGGGTLAIADELAYMIAGPGPTTGKVFYRRSYNDKHRSIDPFTGKAIMPWPFFSVTLGFSTDQGFPLPALGMRRVFVLTSANTCSASEAIMSGLAGVAFPVIQIGSTTCGKPYGFVPEDNCGTTYFAIEFQGANDKGFSDYPDGLVPGGSSSPGTGTNPGCVVADDFSHELGDAAEGRLAAALQYAKDGSCPAATAAVAEGAAVRSFWRENAFIDLRPGR
jgi:hypothetical protein